MTREEASFILANIDRRVCDDELNEALDMAIKALEQEPCEDWYDVPSNEMTVEQARQAVKDLRKKLAEHLEQQSCEDAISRQEAVEAFQMFREYESNRSSGEWVDRIETVLNQLPPVTPEPKTGYWIGWGKDMTDESYKCSECGELSPYDYDFCPHCGIKNGKCTHYEDEYMEAQPCQN